MANRRRSERHPRRQTVGSFANSTALRHHLLSVVRGQGRLGSSVAGNTHASPIALAWRRACSSAPSPPWTQLAAAGRLLDIPVHDHVIIGRGRYVSFAEAGLL